MYRPNVSTVVVAMGRQRHLVVVVRRWGRWVVCWRLGGGSRWVECSPAHWGWGTWCCTHRINVRRRFLNVCIIFLSDPLKLISILIGGWSFSRELWIRWLLGFCSC